jgi:hypothetical protein
LVGIEHVDPRVTRRAAAEAGEPGEGIMRR